MVVDRGNTRSWVVGEVSLVIMISYFSICGLRHDYNEYRLSLKDYHLFGRYM